METLYIFLQHLPAQPPLTHSACPDERETGVYAARGVFKNSRFPPSYANAYAYMYFKMHYSCAKYAVLYNSCYTQEKLEKKTCHKMHMYLINQTISWGRDAFTKMKELKSGLSSSADVYLHIITKNMNKWRTLADQSLTHAYIASIHREHTCSHRQTRSTPTHV